MTLHPSLLLMLILVFHKMAAGNSISDSDTSPGFFEPDIDNVCSLEVTCDGARGNRIPLQLPRGRDGKDGKRGPQGAKGPVGAPGKPGKPIKEMYPSAFMARLDSHMYAANFEATTETLLYSSVEPDVGGDFDLTTGMFTAPKNGTYFFSITVAAHKYKHAALELRTSTTGFVGRVWVTSRPVWSSASSTFIVRLNQGASVWTKPIKDAQEYYGNGYCRFSGHVLFYDSD